VNSTAHMMLSIHGAYAGLCISLSVWHAHACEFL